MIVLDKMCRKYTSPVRFWGGTSLYLIVHDVEDVQTILKSPHCLKRMYVYDFLKEGVSDKTEGLFTLNGNEWKMHRKYVGQSFGLNAMYGNLPTFNKHIRSLISALHDEIGRQEFDIRLAVNRATIDMFLESTLGTDFTNEEKKRYSYYLTKGQQVLSKRLFLPWYQINWVWKLSGYSELIKKYRLYSSTLIDRVMATKTSANLEDRTFIDRLLQISEMNENFTREDVKTEITSLLMGASDTTAFTIAFTVLLLAMHPQYQERCYQELKEVLPRRDFDVTSDDLEKMVYTEQCIKETLRLFPAVSVIGRCPERSIQLKHILVQPGQSVLVALRQLMRKPEYWGNDADQFNPDHCSQNKLDQLHPFAYIPFSEGARNCVAYKYGMVVVKTMLVHLFRNYRYTTSLRYSDLKIRLNVNSRLLNNHMVQVHERTDSD